MLAGFDRSHGGWVVDGNYRARIAEGEERLDYVLIDCPPSLGLLTLNALVAGAEMMIPIQAEYYALEGLGQLLETVEMVKKHLNNRLEVSTILITMYDARTRLAAAVAEEVREIMDRMTAAMTSKDLAALAACYAEDAVAVTPDQGELSGRDAIRS